MRTLLDHFAAVVSNFPESIAAADSHVGAVRYREFESLTEKICARLCTLGVEPGARIGLLLPSSVSALAAFYAVFKAHAACVPVAADLPAERVATIFREAAVTGVLMSPETFAYVGEALRADGFVAAAAVVDTSLAQTALLFLGRSASYVANSPDLALILYTSGSCGPPKGVMLSHENLASAVDWYARACCARAGDRFLSQAPLHFSASLFNLFVPARCGGEVFLADDCVRAHPGELAKVVSEKRISKWMCAPAVLRLMMRYGGLAGLPCDALEVVMFGGEVFPTKYFEELR